MEIGVWKKNFLTNYTSTSWGEVLILQWNFDSEKSNLKFLLDKKVEKE